MISGANEEELKIANERADLLLENQQLKDRINKAIECIEKVLNSYKENPENALGLNIIGLLKILKEDNKEIENEDSK